MWKNLIKSWKWSRPNVCSSSSLKVLGSICLRHLWNQEETSVWCGNIPRRWKPETVSVKLSVLTVHFDTSESRRIRLMFFNDLPVALWNLPEYTFVSFWNGDWSWACTGQMVLCTSGVERATPVQLKAWGDAFRFQTDEFSYVNKVSYSATEEKVLNQYVE